MRRSARVCTALCAAWLALAAACGKERWSIKVGSDQDASKVDMSTVVQTTIQTMIQYPAPSPLPPDRRVAPQEFTLYGINATMVGFKLETDEDFHVVIADANQNTMIIEIPAPSCVPTDSPFYKGVVDSRSTFTAAYQPTPKFQNCNVPVSVIGCGFFDFAHGQVGLAPNAIELHPVQWIAFG